jgi:hypothetical protein
MGMHRLREPLQFADIKVGNPVKVPNVAGGQSRPLNSAVAAIKLSRALMP